MMKNKILFIITLIGVLTIGCANDHEEDLIVPVAPTTMTTYTSNVKSIMDNNCISCHTAGGAASWYPLETYDEVKAAALTGNLYGRMTSANAPMPPSGLLPAVTTQTIQSWIDDGLLEQ